MCSSMLIDALCVELKCQALVFGSLDGIWNPPFCAKWGEEDVFDCFPLVCKDQTGYAWQYLIKDGWKIKYYECDPSGLGNFLVFCTKKWETQKTPYIPSNIFLGLVLPFFTGYFMSLLPVTL